MDDTERGLLIADYVKNIALGADMILMDPDNLAFMRQEVERADEKVRHGYAFPMMDYSKVDLLDAQNEQLRCIIALCEARLKMREAAKPQPRIDDVFQRLLGF